MGSFVNDTTAIERGRDMWANPLVLDKGGKRTPKGKAELNIRWLESESSVWWVRLSPRNAGCWLPVNQ